MRKFIVKLQAVFALVCFGLVANEALEIGANTTHALTVTGCVAGLAVGAYALYKFVLFVTYLWDHVAAYLRMRRYEKEIARHLKWQRDVKYVDLRTRREVQSFKH